MKLAELDTPVLLVNKDLLSGNLRRMEQMTASAGIAYRPHAKAHKSYEIAKLQLSYGASGICCAKLGEAEVLVSEGVKDILITTPVIGVSKLTRLAALMSRSSAKVVVESYENIREMELVGRSKEVTFNVVIEVNVGQNRCGSEPGQPTLELAKIIAASPWLSLVGLQGYQGAIQMVVDSEEREVKAKKASSLLLETKELIKNNGIDIPVLTGGGTGTSKIDACGQIFTEIQPGGYIFMDARYGDVQWGDGKKIPFEQSLTVLGSVISRPDSKRAIVDVGLKSISSDQGVPKLLNIERASFKFAGEEHGEVIYDNGACPLNIGDKISLIPTHCDTTVNLYDHFIIYSGDSVTDVWKIGARGRSQ